MQKWLYRPINKSFFEVCIYAHLTFLLCFLVPRLLAVFDGRMGLYEGVTLSCLGLATGSFLQFFWGNRGHQPARFFLFLTMIMLPASIHFISNEHIYYFVFFLILLCLGFLTSSVFKKVNVYQAMFYDMIGVFLGILVIYSLPYLGAQRLFIFLLIISLLPFIVYSNFLKRFFVIYLFLGLIGSFWVPERAIDILHIAHDVPQPYVDNEDVPVRNGFKMIKSGAKHVATQVSFYSRVDVLKSSIEKFPEYPIYFDNIFFSVVSNKENTHIGKHIAVPKNAKTALVLGAGGGKDIQAIQPLVVERIDAVELNDSMYNLMTGNEILKRVSGDIYHRANVVLGEGRKFLESTKNKYDYISMNYTDTIYEFNIPLLHLESYLYTKEAIQLYFQHLNPSGNMLIANKIHGGDILAQPVLRMLQTIVSVLKEQGKKPHNHLLFEMQDRFQNKGSFNASIIIGNSEFSHSETERIKSLSKKKGNTTFISGANCASEDHLFCKVINNDTSFYKELDRRQETISPISDNWPFLYYFNKEKWFNISDFNKILLMTSIIFLSLVFLFLKKIRFDDHKEKFYLESFLISAFGFLLGCLQGLTFISFSIIFLQPIESLFIYFLSVCLSNFICIFKGEKIIHKAYSFVLISLIATFLIIGIPGARYYISDLPFFLKLILVLLTVLPIIMIGSISFLVITDTQKKRSKALGSYCYGLSSFSIVIGAGVIWSLILRFGIFKSWIFVLLGYLIATTLMVQWQERKSHCTDPV